MENGKIYVEVLIFFQRVKLVNHLNLLKFQERTGEEIQIMRCCKEYTEHAGEIKKS